MDERDDLYSDNTETIENKFGDGYEAFRKSAVQEGRRSTVIVPKDSTTRSGLDFFNGQKEVDENETYTESKGAIPPDLQVEKSSYEDRNSSESNNQVNMGAAVYKQPGENELQARNRFSPSPVYHDNQIK